MTDYQVSVSVVMPLFNSETTVAESIHSVVLQTYQDWELVVIDDGSTDKGAAVVREYMREDSRIRLISLSDNCGAGRARSAGILDAKGRYIAFLDSDDLWKQDKLAIQIGFMREKKAPFTCSYFEEIKVTGTYSSIRTAPASFDYAELLKENVVGCLTAIYDVEHFGKRLMPSIRKRQDYALWLELIKDCDLCYCIPESLAVYRQQAGSISSNKIEMLKFNYRMFRECEEFSPLRAAYYMAHNILRKILRSRK